MTKPPNGRVRIWFGRACVEVSGPCVPFLLIGVLVAVIIAVLTLR